MKLFAKVIELFSCVAAERSTLDVRLGPKYAYMEICKGDM